MTDIVWEGADELRQHLVPINDLCKFPTNPMHDSRVPNIVKSLRKHGQVRPIVTWMNATEHGQKENTIVAGHHVWWAAENEQWTHVAAIPNYFPDFQAAQDYLSRDNLTGQRNAAQIAAQLSLADDADMLDQQTMDELTALVEHAPEVIEVSSLKMHDRSIRKSPDQIIEHLVSRLKEYGWTSEQVIIARDGTILVGEDVMRAAAMAGIDKVPVKRMDIDPESPEALQIMAMDYASGKRAMVDERAFGDMLKQIRSELDTLEGSGYDPEMLSLLLLQSRPATEIRDINEAREWVGLAEYSPVKLPVKHIISFEDEATREEFFTKANAAGLELGTIKTTVGTTSGWWPHRERQDPGSLRFRDSTRDQKSAV